MRAGAASEVGELGVEGGARVILVLGTHRSGTSAVARALPLLGVSLGERLLPPRADNPTGFWEDPEIVSLNERLLSALGRYWHSVSPMGAHDWQAPPLQTLFAEAAELVRCATARWGAWGFKDPRTARLLPFWQSVLREVGADEGYVISVRHPLSVARSLGRRNGLSEAKSHLLWLQHMLPALALSRGRPRVVVDYDLLLDDPALQIRRVARALRLEVPGEEARAAYATEFLSEDLRHTRFSMDDLRVSTAWLPLVARAYALALQLARDECAENDPEGPAALEVLLDELEGISPLLCLLDERVDERDQLRDEQLGWRQEVGRVAEDHQKEVARIAAERDQMLAARDAAWRQEVGRVAEDHQKEIARIAAERDQMLAARDAAWRQEVGRVAEDHQKEIARIAAERDQMLAARDAAWRQEVGRVAEDHQREIARIGAERDQMLAAKDAAWRQEVERVAGDHQKEIARIGAERDQMLAAKDAAWRQEVERVSEDLRTEAAKVIAERDTLARIAPLVSVVVVNYDGEQHLRLLLPSLLAQTYPRLEIVVVDNASTDSSVDLLTRMGAEVRVIRAARNLGFAGGNNLGVAAARGEYVALINNDAVADRDWLRPLVLEIESDPAVAAVGSKITFLQPYLRLILRAPVFRPVDRGLSADTRELGLYLDETSRIEGCAYHKPMFRGGFGGRESAAGRLARWTAGQAELLLPFEPEGGDKTLLLIASGGPANAGQTFTVELAGRTIGEGVLAEGFAEYRFALPEAAVARHGRYLINNAASLLDDLGATGDRGIFTLDEGQYDRAEDVPALCGGSMLLRRSVFERVGGFDPVFFMYFEDVDLSWRLRRQGFRLRYQPASVVRHTHAGTSTEGSPLFVFFTARNRLLMLLKNAPWSSVLSAYRQEARYTTSLFLAWLRAPKSGRAAAFESFWLRARVLASALLHTPGALVQRRGA